MRILFIILTAASLLSGDGFDLLPDDGEKQGRRGNELYGLEDYELAAEAYAEGLDALAVDAPERLRYALENNLGAALLKAGDVAGAREAFDRALVAASVPSDAARTWYNAGNASYAEKDLAKAVERYRQSLLQDPTNQDAKFNYEFAKRQLEQQQQQQQGSNQQQQQQQKQQQNGQGEQDEGEPQQEEEQQQQSGGQNQQQGSEPEQNQEERQSSSSAQETPTELSEEQAQRILQALQNEEEQLLREVQRPKSRPRRVEKDW